jgi:hypothetical protein
MDSVEHYTDLRQNDLDPDLFAAALAVQQIRKIIVHGGSEFGRPEDEDALQPQHLEVFLGRAAEHAGQTKRFEQEWQTLQQLVPHIRNAWKKGQTRFQDDLTRALGSQEEMEYLPQIEFAVDCYAHVAARNSYPKHQVLQAWFANGYMVAWREYFLEDQEGEGQVEDKL